MWQWFTTNSVWIFIAATLVLILFFLIRGPVQRSVEIITPERWLQRIHRTVSVAFWAIEGITLVIVVLALLAIMLSREGIHAMVTPETVQRWFLVHGAAVLVILVAGFVLWFILQRFLPPLLRRVMARPIPGESKEGIKKRTDTLLSVFMGAGKVLIILLVLFMALSELDVDITPILAGFGIAGIAVGFGAQYLIRDLIAGIFILLENQYRVGDVARVADIAGLVEEINLRKTVLRDLDGIVHHVPNGEIKVASNFSRHFSRVNLNISVAYGTDLDQAIAVINRVGQGLAADGNWRKLIKSAPQVLRVDNLGDSGIEIKILGDVKPLQQWAVMGELRLRLKKAFDEANIEIPWPHVKLYFGDSPVSKGPICKACSHVNVPGSRFCANCGVSLSS